MTELFIKIRVKLESQEFNNCIIEILHLKWEL